MSSSASSRPMAGPPRSALLEGLGAGPPKAIDYRGTTFYELDTDAVIARHPEWVLVDELAHTNIPGTRHAKRWQSVEEIRDAGINVISTLNIQHLESLNDAVYEITGRAGARDHPRCDRGQRRRDRAGGPDPGRPDQPPASAATSTRARRSRRRWPTSSAARTSSPCASWPCARPRRRWTPIWPEAMGPDDVEQARPRTSRSRCWSRLARWRPA